MAAAAGAMGRLQPAQTPLPPPSPTRVLGQRALFGPTPTRLPHSALDDGRGGGGGGGVGDGGGGSGGGGGCSDDGGGSDSGGGGGGDAQQP